MNILFAASEVKAQARLMAQGLQALNHAVSFSGIELQLLTDKPQGKDPVDVIHFHDASLVATYLSSSSVYKSYVPTLIQYDLSELRTRADSIRYNPYANLDLSYQDDATADRLQKLSSVFHACIVESHEAAEYAVKYHRRVYIVPRAVDVSTISHVPQIVSNHIPRIVHPYTDDTQDTEFIRQAISRLREQGYRFDYVDVKYSNTRDMSRIIHQADIVVDQLIHGSYGIIALLAMAHGKPVISHIREDLKAAHYHELPIISANPATIYRKLASLLNMPKTWADLGEAGRNYVERHHQIQVVVNKLLWAYRRERKQFNSSSDDTQRMIFDSFTGKVTVGQEDSGEGEEEGRIAISSPTQPIVEPCTDGEPIVVDADDKTTQSAPEVRASAIPSQRETPVVCEKRATRTCANIGNPTRPASHCSSSKPRAVHRKRTSKRQSNVAVRLLIRKGAPKGKLFLKLYVNVHTPRKNVRVRMTQIQEPNRKARVNVKTKVY